MPDSQLPAGDGATGGLAMLCSAACDRSSTPDGEKTASEVGGPNNAGCVRDATQVQDDHQVCTSPEEGSDEDGASTANVLFDDSDSPCALSDDGDPGADNVGGVSRGTKRQHTAGRDEESAVKARRRVDGLHRNPSWTFAPIQEQHLSAFWTANRASATARLRVMRAVAAKGDDNAARHGLLAAVIHDVSRSPASFNAFIRNLRAQRT